jgi:ABC-type phosphate/phosphonate transport system permease subunit
MNTSSHIADKSAAAAPLIDRASVRWYGARRQAALLMLLYGCLIAACVVSLFHAGDLSLGRKPWQNLMATAGELSRPSFLDVWFGNPQLEYKSDDGSVLRVEDQRASEARFLASLGGAIWTTLKIATLGSLLAAILGAPLGFLSAKNMHAPWPVAWFARRLLDVCRSIHTLVFGLLIVGIIGLGPMAGILAIALHSMGTWGKLYAESIETLDMRPIEACGHRRHTTVFLFAVWPAPCPTSFPTISYLGIQHSRFDRAGPDRRRRPRAAAVRGGIAVPVGRSPRC